MNQKQNEKLKTALKMITREIQILTPRITFKEGEVNRLIDETFEPETVVEQKTLRKSKCCDLLTVPGFGASRICPQCKREVKEPSKQETGENEKDKLWDKLGEILNVLPDIDPFDDEAWVTDKLFPKFKKVVDEAYQKGREDRTAEIKNAMETEEQLIHVKGLSMENWNRVKLLLK